MKRASSAPLTCALLSSKNKNKLALCPFRAKPGRGVWVTAVLRQPMQIVSNVFCGYETLKHRAFLRPIV